MEKPKVKGVADHPRHPRRRYGEEVHASHLGLHVRATLRVSQTIDSLSCHCSRWEHAGIRVDERVVVHVETHFLILVACIRGVGGE
jgi:hypothetical protein